MAGVPPRVPVDAKISRHLKTVVAIAGFVSALGGGVLAFITTMHTFSLKVESLATDAEVAAAIKAHNEMPRAHGSDYARSPHPDYAAAASKTDALAMQLDSMRSEQRKRDIELFSMLVSLQAADWEPNKKHAAQTAEAARQKYRAAVRGGMEPPEAAEHVLQSSRPPHMR